MASRAVGREPGEPPGPSTHTIVQRSPSLPDPLDEGHQSGLVQAEGVGQPVTGDRSAGQGRRPGGQGLQWSSIPRESGITQSGGRHERLKVRRLPSQGQTVPGKPGQPALGGAVVVLLRTRRRASSAPP